GVEPRRADQVVPRASSAAAVASDRVTKVPASAPGPDYAAEVLSWTAPDAKAYVKSHITRLEKTLRITPGGGPGDKVLEMGAYLQLTPALKPRLGYGGVRGCYYGPAGLHNRRKVVSDSGDHFECEMDHFNAEKDPFPYPAVYF